MDIFAAFLKGLPFKEIAKETGDALRPVQLDLPAADVCVLQKLPCMADDDNAKEILNLLKA
eukprot:11251220-Prorocentrum_lima.AAC.1